MGSWFARLFCCKAGGSNFRKYNPTAAAAPGSCEDDALIGILGTDTGEIFDTSSSNGIAILSRGKIKYVNGGSHIGIPIIDPHLIGQPRVVVDYAGDGRHRQQHQRQQLLPQLAKSLVNKNIFHWRQHQRGLNSTPPSSVDLEWEHEGMPLPPLMPDDSGGFDFEDDDDDEEEYVSGRRDGRASRSDSAIHRSPSPTSSVCHSLEWDSNADDFVVQEQRQQHQQDSKVAPVD